MKKLKLVISATVFAACASGILSWWCFAGFPVTIGEDSFFDWDIIPMGAIHGAILAFLAIGASTLLYKKNMILCILFTPFIGYIAGHYSLPPLMWGIDPSGSFPWENYWMIFFNYDESIDLSIPYMYFGLVSSIYYLFMCVFKQLYNNKLLHQVLIGIASGVLGSLWFWIANEYWYISPLHGIVWGAFVGYGIWISNGRRSSTD